MVKVIIYEDEYWPYYGISKKHLDDHDEKFHREIPDDIVEIIDAFDALSGAMQEYLKKRYDEEGP